MDIRKRRTPMETYFDGLQDCPTKRTRAFEFYQKLRAFYKKKWNAPLRPPYVHGVEVDLFKLYETVMGMGGWLKTCQDDKWFEVAEILGITDDCFMGDHGVKTLYLRYLSKYEQNETIGDIDDMLDNEFGRTVARRQFSSFVPNECPISIPFRRDTASTSHEPNYTRLVRSMISGLPNEVDFALNICTLLSHPGPRLMRVSNANGLLTLLVAATGVFDEYEEDLAALHKDLWTKNSDHDFFRFWATSGLGDEELEILVPHVASHRNNESFSLFIGLNPTFNPKDPVSWRVQQVLTIIRNLSFESVNRVNMAQHWPIMKFLLCCANCKYPPLFTNALDALGNLACDIELTWEKLQYSAKHLLLETMRRGIFSDDKFKVMRCMELLGGLSTHEKNESLLSDFLSTPLFSRIIDMLGVRDIMMCVYTLECLYQLSEIGPSVCEALAVVPNLIKILISMTTIEAVSFGKEGLVGMKVVEYHNPLAGPPPSLSMPQQAHPVTAAQTPHLQATPRVALQAAVRPTLPQSAAPTPILQQAALPPVQAPGHVPNHVPTGQFGCDLNIERLTFNWIRQNCVYQAGSWTARGELYAAYVDDLRNHHHSLSGSLNTFSNIMASIFPETVFKMAESSQTPLMAALGIRLVKPHKLVTQQGAMVTLGGAQTTMTLNSINCQVGGPSPAAAPHPSPSPSVSAYPVMQQMLQRPNGVPNGLPPARRPSLVSGPPPAHSTPILMDSKPSPLPRPPSNQVCATVVEARDLIDETKHETIITRVENVNCSDLQRGSSSQAPGEINEQTEDVKPAKLDQRNTSRNSSSVEPAETKENKEAKTTSKSADRSISRPGAPTGDCMCEWDGCGKL
ncbi:unnamed protein product, partial [Mesorhabditis belari]|uniref:ARID domain-containing protein n=1 Tax=Mesorhabditis belari TaxID=2138241 RepID=A0AAF3FJG9_9BILA